MRMDRSGNSIILLLLLILSGCGQVGTITGGPVDNEAPKPILTEIQPPQASKNISPNKIEIPFDEYIAMNKPAENIKVAPNDVMLDHSIQGKTLVLSKTDGEWEKNTTYSIYLNRAVKDITENNDSIMLYVFSTGPVIDSLKASVVVQNAYDQKPVKDITIGLYENELLSDTANQEPRYFSTSDKSGLAQFEYLKSGDYFVYAFQDENRNNKLDANESRGKMMKHLIPHPTDTVLDTLILMPPPEKELRVLSNEFISQGVWCLGFNKPVSDSYKLSFSGDDLIDSVWNRRKDSITFFLENPLSGNETLIIKSEFSTDTITKRFFYKEKPGLSASNNLTQDHLPFGDTLTFSWNDGLKKVDTSSIISSATVDSSKVQLTPKYIIVESNKLKVFNLPRKANSVSISFLPNAITGNNLHLADTLELDFTLGKEKDLGSLNIVLDTIPSHGVIILHSLRKEVKRKAIKNKNLISFSHLKPGKYSFSILIDSNENGTWDTGDIFKNRPAERMLWFNQTSTVRANWEVETTLNIKNKLE